MNRLKILLIGDIHILPEDYEQCNIAFNSIVDNIIKKNDYDLCVFAGDILNDFSKTYIVSLFLALDYINFIANEIPVYIISGNHDLLSTHNSNDNWLGYAEKYLNHKNIFNFHKSQVKTINGIKIMFAGYRKNGEYIDHLDTIDPTWKETTDIVFAHQEFRGVFMGSYQSTTGDVWEDSYPFCISGHIHNYHVLQPNLVYSGRLFSTRKENGKKYVIEVDINKGRNPMITHTPIKIPGVITHVTKRFTGSDIIKDRTILDFVRKPNHSYRILYTCNVLEYEAINRMKIPYKMERLVCKEGVSEKTRNDVHDISHSQENILLKLSRKRKIEHIHNEMISTGKSQK